MEAGGIALAIFGGRNNQVCDELGGRPEISKPVFAPSLRNGHVTGQI